MLEKLLVKKILEQSHQYTWTIQGFGMLRLYLDPEVQLSVWDSRYQAKPRPSMIHDHPWSFSSLIVAGELTNSKYLRFPRGINGINKPPYANCDPYMERVITPGHGLMQQREDLPVWLWCHHTMTHLEGQRYWQGWNEIHETSYEDGTVTIITRDRGGRPDLAKTFWREELGWQTAEPRAATIQEVRDICVNSLNRWF